MITILMAAYNGEKYIREQIESILHQTVSDWKLVIQDDCSKDNTACIAKEYAECYPHKMRFVQRNVPTGSAKSNFFSMLKYADSEYCMTCDDDDIWLPNKIELTLQKMVQLESKNDVNIPLLVHTDLIVADSNLNVISNSMFQRQNLDSSKNQFHNILVQNIVTGCTMMANRALLDMVEEIPKQAIMHDWWFALIASAFGEIGFVNRPTIHYRQHDNNEVGAKDAKNLKYQFSRMCHKDEICNALAVTYLQAQCFLDTYEKNLSPKHIKIIKDYLLIPDLSKLKKIKMLVQCDFLKNTFARKIAHIIFV